MTDEHPSPSTPATRWRLWLAVEFTVLFLVAPILLIVEREQFGSMIIPTLVLLGVVCLALLLLDRRFERRRLWQWGDLGEGLRHIFKTFVPGALVLTVLLALWRPELLLRFPRENTGLWLVVMVAYPVLSVYPQEVIFRTFLFHRYRNLLPTPVARITASGTAFGAAHLFFGNWIAPVLTTLGGFLFARTYQRSKSTFQASLEHALWGDFLFTVGLGWYFYGGSIGS
jgi:membrane protease YdiL (CAAX protease family)